MHKSNVELARQINFVATDRVDTPSAVPSKFQCLCSSRFNGITFPGHQRPCQRKLDTIQVPFPQNGRCNFWGLHEITKSAKNGMSHINRNNCKPFQIAIQRSNRRDWRILPRPQTKVEWMPEALSKISSKDSKDPEVDLPTTVRGGAIGVQV